MRKPKTYQVVRDLRSGVLYVERIADCILLRTHERIEMQSDSLKQVRKRFPDVCDLTTLRTLNRKGNR